MPTSGVIVVPQSSATALCNRSPHPITANHIEIVKPANRTDPRYMRFARPLRDAIRARAKEPPPLAATSGQMMNRDVREKLPPPAAVSVTRPAAPKSTTANSPPNVMNPPVVPSVGHIDVTASVLNTIPGPRGAVAAPPPTASHRLNDEMRNKLQPHGILLNNLCGAGNPARHFEKHGHDLKAALESLPAPDAQSLRPSVRLYYEDFEALFKGSLEAHALKTRVQSACRPTHNSSRFAIVDRWQQAIDEVTKTTAPDDHP